MVLLARSFFALVLLFIMLLTAIQAQPYDDSELRALLTPPAGCPAPCFLGIRLGVTTTDEAIAILKQHEWVAQVKTQYTDYDNTIHLFWGWVYWDWKPPRDAWSSGRSLAGHSGAMKIVQGFIHEVLLATPFTLGHLILAMGQPSGYQLGEPAVLYIGGGNPRVHPISFGFNYSDTGLTAGTSDDCPLVTNLWDNPAVITLTQPPVPLPANPIALTEAVRRYNGVCGHRR
jgi:hypothetical protein